LTSDELSAERSRSGGDAADLAADAAGAVDGEPHRAVRADRHVERMIADVDRFEAGAVAVGAGDRPDGVCRARVVEREVQLAVGTLDHREHAAIGPARQRWRVHDRREHAEPGDQLPDVAAVARADGDLEARAERGDGVRATRLNGKGVDRGGPRIAREREHERERQARADEPAGVRPRDATSGHRLERNSPSTRTGHAATASLDV